MNEILVAKNITKIYPQENKFVLENVSLSVREGDFISILGASGSGKTTLLSLLAGMDRPTKGEIYLDGKNICTEKEKNLAILRRTKIGFVFQFFNLAPYLTVKENIMLPIFLNRLSLKKYEEKYQELTDYLSIGDIEKKLPSMLSGGEQQRVAIARSLIYSPKIIFLDEPTGNLDSNNAEEMMKLLVKINREKGTTVMQVTHSEQNAQYGNRIMRICDGKILEEQSKDEPLTPNKPEFEAEPSENGIPDDLVEPTLIAEFTPENEPENEPENTEEEQGEGE